MYFKAEGLGEWLKWKIACPASMRPWVQALVPQKMLKIMKSTKTTAFPNSHFLALSSTTIRREAINMVPCRYKQLIQFKKH
jgi:hypothetical protein